MAQWRIIYDPKLPLTLARTSQVLDFKADPFMDWCISLLRNKPAKGKVVKKLNTPAKILVWTDYYVWVAYVFSAVIVTSQHVVFGLLCLLISPFIAVGYAYAFVYVYEHLWLNSNRTRL